MTAQVVLDMTAQGPVSTPPQTLRGQLDAIAQSLDPGVTTQLPGALIEDIASTDVGALVVIDSALQDLINSVSPLRANLFLLIALGQIYGVPQGTQQNTSVFVVFSGPPAGYIIQKGFIVSDGTHQYVIQDGGVIESGGSSAPLFAVANQSGTWAVPANTVTQLITSVPTSVSLAVTNPNTGTPQSSAQTPDQYRAQVLQAGRSTAVGMPEFLRTQLQNVTGVQGRLVSVRQQDTNWEVICGGGDPYAVAYAIYIGLGAGISSLVGSTINITGITNATLGLVTTDLNHGYSNGQVITIAGVTGMSGVNGTRTVAVVSEKTFTIGVDTTGSGTYTGGGVVTPNFRNIAVSINSFPDTYEIIYVDPPQQTAGIVLTWNTTAPNFVSPDAVAQLAQPAIINYINSVEVGQPINLFQLDSIFQTAIASLIPIEFISKIDWAITINSVSTDPDMGTGLIEGDPESYFFTDTSHVTVTQG